MNIEPIIKIGGSAFVGNTTQAYRPIPEFKDRDSVTVVSLREWCDRNFISRRVGYKLIQLKYLIAIKRHGQWWVCANPDCIEQLLEYLGVEKLSFDVPE